MTLGFRNKSWTVSSVRGCSNAPVTRRGRPSPGDLTSQNACRIEFTRRDYSQSRSSTAKPFNSCSIFPSQRHKMKRKAQGPQCAAVDDKSVESNQSSPQGLEKWVIAAEQAFNVAATEAVVKILEVLYANRLYARFYVLETIARVPYFAFVSVLHLYESFGWWRRADYLKIHFAESWNELHHLLVMEALGGDERWVDRFLAQHIAVIYYFMTSFMYIVSPRMAYNFSECVEKHAYLTYDKFIKSHGEELKKLPAPRVAVQYYTKGNLYMFDEFQTDVTPNSRRPTVDNLYDVFYNIREDEAQHCRTMQACQTGVPLLSPHRDVALTEVANDEPCAMSPADCAGIIECATTASSFAERVGLNGSSQEM